MNKPLVTVAIPTCNRCSYLGTAISSVLDQTMGDLELLVIDNASTDSTEALAKSFCDRRLQYFRNDQNIGIIENWNRAIELAKGDYLIILGDDDRLTNSFLEESVRVHKAHPNVGLSFSHCNKVDQDGRYIRQWGYDFMPAGLARGVDYLYWTLHYEACLTNSSTALLKTSVLRKHGKFVVAYARNVFDFNMWIKIASDFDVYFIDKNLCDYRIHPLQVSQLHWRDKFTGKIGTYLELFHILSLLVSRSYPFSEDYLEIKIEHLTQKMAEYLKAEDDDL